MKKIIAYTMSSISLLACSKEDANIPNDYTSEEIKALEVFRGTFVGTVGVSERTIVFSPFGKPVPKTNPINGVSIKFDGKMTDNDIDYYFNLSLEDCRIYANATVSNSDEYNFYVGKTYNYKIVNDNTIELYDTSLGNSLLHTYTYKRK